MSEAAAVFETIRRRSAPGIALAAKLAGGNAVEASADGAAVRLSDGRELIDFGSYGVTLLGHRHPAVLSAIAAQLRSMPTGTRMLANPATAAFMEALSGRLDGRLERVWLGSDGADAVELAIKLARRATGRPRVLAVAGAFHGKTLGALALTANAAFHCGLGGLGQVTHVDVLDVGAVAREVAAGDVAALVFEPIQGESGARVLDVDTLACWSTDAHAAGAFVISDEVQAGLRRCGPVSVALESGIAVDGVLFGKALAGGLMPLSALTATSELFAPLAADPTWHTTTFGGHPLACAAGSAALVAIDELAGAAEQIGALLDDGLRWLAQEHGTVVRALHGRGLLRAVELVSPAVAGTVVVELMRAGLLVSPCLSAPSAIRLLPPMVTTSRQLALALAALEEALGAAAAAAEESDLADASLEPTAVRGAPG